MGVLGARPGDLKKSIAGDPAATERVIFGYYVWPHLQKMLERYKLIDLPPVIDLSPDPDRAPGGVHIHHDFVPAALGRILGHGGFRGDPTPQPNIAIEAHLNVLSRFREGLAELDGVLNEEITQLEGMLKARSS